MNSSGSGSSSPTPLCEAANAASRPSGASTRSIENAQASGATSSSGRTPSAARSRSAELTRSRANWQRSATATIASVRASSDGDGLPASTKTSAGASAYQELPSRTSTRSGGCTPARYSGSSPSSAPAAAQRGTCAGGSRNSISTSTSWVAMAAPLPTSNLSRQAAAKAATSTSTIQPGGRGRAGPSTASASAARTKPPDEIE